MVTPFSNQCAVGAIAQLAFGERELPAVVHSLCLLGRRLDASDAVAHLREHGDHVGEVVLALRVVGRQLAQRRAEQVASECIDAGAHLVNVEFVG